MLGQEIWTKTEELNHFEALRRERIKELVPSLDKSLNPFLLLFDNVYNNLNEKFIKLFKEKDELYARLNYIKSKIKNEQLRFKIKK